MAGCRIYLFTYKRNQLLPRAVKSLINQTFTDWICEVHNDCPGDLFPENYINSLNDPRFIVKNHPENLGPTTSFNLAFSGCEENYASILEDDNWWESTFLDEMIHLMSIYPDLSVLWCNMRIWKEKANMEWKDTGETTWPVNGTTSFINWPDVAQVMGAMHSNGAMIYKGGSAPNYIIPENTLFDAVELVRERSFEHPICLFHKPLANFSRTLKSSRSGDAGKWIGSQMMMVGSFLAAAPDKNEAVKTLLNHYRQRKNSSLPNFFLATLFILNKPSWLAYLNFRDWLLFCKWGLRNFHRLPSIRNYLKTQKNVYHFLLKNSEKRFRENASR
jgi:glycosyltransferase involved in cell wall biosynthesis